MKIRGLCAAILWFAVVAYPCSAQLMSASQYRDYMKGLDAAAERWQKQIKAIDAGKMNVDYPSGKRVDRARGAILDNLKLMRGFIVQQHSLEALSVDISIENTLGDASEQVSVLLDTLPQNQEGLSWMRTVADTIPEMADQQVQLRKHIDAFANKLQLEAIHCSK